MAKVLVIWANPSERHVLEAMLRNRYDVIGVASLPEATPCIARRRCDAIIAKQGKTDSTGFAVLDRLRSEDLDIPTIILSGHSDDNVEGRAKEMGAVAVLRPPIHARHLYEALNRAMAKKTNSQAKEPQNELRVKDMKGRLVVLRVLVADTDESERHVLETMLNGKYEVVAVEGGREAIAELKAGIFDAVLAKLNRDGKCAMAVLRYLSAKGRDVPLLAVAGPGTSGAGDQARRFGACHIFHPPLSAGKVLNALQDAVLRQRQSSLAQSRLRQGVGYRPI